MKGWQVLTVVVLLMITVAVGWGSQQAINGVNHNSAGGGGAGRGHDAENLALNPIYGTSVRFEVNSENGHLVNIYFTNLTGLMAARENGSFAYLPQYSQMNTTHLSVVLELPSTTDIYEVVIVSSDPQDIVPCTASSDQSSLPIDLQPVFQAVSFICWISSITLIVLSVHSYSRYRIERDQT